MRTILLLAMGCLGLQFCKLKSTHQNGVAIVASINDTVNYAMQIQPLLQKKCSPCHFSGGKMYERMPFDKGETIVSHEAGILRRIKDESTVSLIKQYIQQSKASKS